MAQFKVGDRIIDDRDILEQYQALRDLMSNSDLKQLTFLTTREIMDRFDLPRDKWGNIWGRTASLVGLPRGAGHG